MQFNLGYETLPEVRHIMKSLWSEYLKFPVPSCEERFIAPSFAFALPSFQMDGRDPTPIWKSLSDLAVKLNCDCLLDCGALLAGTTNKWVFSGNRGWWLTPKSFFWVTKVWMLQQGCCRVPLQASGQEVSGCVLFWYTEQELDGPRAHWSLSTSLYLSCAWEPVLCHLWWCQVTPTSSLWCLKRKNRNNLTD